MDNAAGGSGQIVWRRALNAVAISSTPARLKRRLQGYPHRRRRAESPQRRHRIRHHIIGTMRLTTGDFDQRGAVALELARADAADAG
jgi:hypothetical protein